VNVPALACAITFCLLLNAAVVVWIKRRDRPASPPPGAVAPPAAGIALKAGLRQADAELIMKINGMMTSARGRVP
jgi:hypothetical protein